MFLTKPAAFSFVLVLLLVAFPGHDRPEQIAPTLAVDDSRQASRIVSRGSGEMGGGGALSRPLHYVNPVYSDPDDRFSKDPAVIQHDGRYYAYYFGFAHGRQAIKVASSPDLVEWLYEGVVLEALKDGAWDADLIWAPDVVFRNGLFYMYYTGGKQRSDGSIDWTTMRIGLATSSKPTGKFVRYDQNPILVPPFGNGAIDAEFFADDDGRDYLFYVVQVQSPYHWEGVRVQRVDNMVGLHDDAKVIDPTAAWEANVVEAPTVFKANGYYYLLYSGGDSENGQQVGYAFSSLPAGSLGGINSWTKYPDDSAPQPLIERGEKWDDLAVGSTALVLGPNGRLYVFFQGKNHRDGKFGLGLMGLSIGSKPTPLRFAH